MGERTATRLLRELSDKVRNSQGHQLVNEAKADALSTPLRKPMRTLMGKYSDPTVFDKTDETNAMSNMLKGTITQDNVQQILQTHVSLDNPEKTSASVESQ